MNPVRKSSAKARTIWITSFHALISRNILGTGLLSMLVQDGFRVVLVVPVEKVRYFEERFGGPQVAVAGADTTLRAADIFFRNLALALTRTRATYIKRRAETKKEAALLFWLVEAGIQCIRLLPGIVSLVRLLDRLVIRSTRAKKLFGSRPSDLLCSTDVQNEIDVMLIHEAKRRGIRTLGLVRSWDNITSKGIPRVVPDVFGVPSKIVAEELRTIGHVGETPIRVVGIPHHDSYWRYTPRSKDLFIRTWKFDKTKPIILFAPIGDRYIRENSLDRTVLATLSTLDANILVRLPPTDVVSLDGFKSHGATVAFHETGVRPWKADRGEGASKRNEMSEEDDATLKEELSHADVLVTGQSTLVVDAAIFDLPSVIINFDSEPRDYYDSVRRYYDYEYYRSIVESGGVALAHSLEELLAVVAVYLKNPQKDAEARAHIAREQSPYGGEATQRLSAVIQTLTERS